MIDLKATFDKYEDDEHCKFERVENKLHPRPDICAFLLLDRLLPDPGKDMVSAAEHDEIYLHIDTERLAEVASEEDILTLSRCGVFYCDDYDCLQMFV